jgi:hypothetical protein
MPLTGEAKKAYQRDLMRKRREGLSGGSELDSSGTESPAAKEPEERANTHLDAVGIALKQGSGPISGKIEHPTIDQPIPKQFEPKRPIHILNTTDQAFEDKKPGYYIFEKTVQLNKDGTPRNCWYCKKDFETRLEMNKFCCPDHKERWLTASLRRGA